MKNDFKHLNQYLEWGDNKSWIDEITDINIPFGSNAGPYDLLYTPYFKDFLTRLDDENIEVVSFTIPAQIGKTLILLCIGLLWAIKHGVPVYYYTDSQTTADELMTNKIEPIVMANKKFLDYIEKDLNGNINRSAIKKNQIQFTNGGSFNTLTVRARQALKGKTTPLVILDEFAELVKASPSSLGDLLERSYGRISQFTGYNRKLLLASTPTYEDENIDKVQSISKQYRYFHQCLECNEEHEIRFEDIRLEGFTKSDTDIIPQKRAIESGEKLYWSCPKCKHKYYEFEKRDMLTRCNWKEQNNPSYDARYINYCFQGTVGHRTWKEIYLQYLGTKEELGKLKTFKNEILAEPWSSGRKQSFSYDDIKRNLIPRGKIGSSKAIATGIDVQTSKLEIFYTVLGFVSDTETVIIDWGIKQYENFEHLKSIVSELHTSQYESMQNTYTFMDSGHYGASIKELCWGISRDKCVAIKGSGSISSLVYRTPSHNSKSLETYHPLGVNKTATNEELDLKIQEGYVTFPIDFEDGIYFEHLANNICKVKNGKKEYDNAGKPIDYRDSLRYALFCGLYFKLHKEKKGQFFF
jgi:phage terminase large subunit GpA-like protein